MVLRITDLVDESILHILKTHHDPGDIQTKNVSESAKILIRSIGTIDILSELQPLLKKFAVIQLLYPDIYSHRASYLWKWIQVAFEITGLNILSNYFVVSHSLKCCSAFVTCLIDDICDTTQDENSLERGIAALSGEISDSESYLHALIYETWSTAQNDIRKAPNYSLLKNEFTQAYEYQIEGFRYCLTLGDYSTIDWDTYLEIVPHTIHVYLAGLIDLLYAPNIRSCQLTQLKRIFLLTQRMAQIGNWVTTWEREIDQRDYTSGVIILAIKNKWVDKDDIVKHRVDVIKREVKRSPSERHLLHLWRESRDESRQLSKQLDMPLIEGYIDSFSAIIFMQLASVGLT